MCRGMWNATKHEISPQDILEEHLRVLERAVEDASEFDVRSKARKSLEYLSVKVDRQGGINLMHAGLRERDVEKLRMGLVLLKKHLGS